MGFDLDKFTSSLLDIEESKTREEVKRQNALAIKNVIERGASANALCNQFRYNQLKDALSYFKVPGRSELTRIKDMSIALVKKIGDDEIVTGIGTKADVELHTLRVRNIRAERQIENLEHENHSIKKHVMGDKQLKKEKKGKKKLKKAKKKKYKDYLNELLLRD